MVLGPTTLEHAAASDQRSASITDAVAVRGGGIPLKATQHHAWILVPEVVDGRRFFDVYTGDHRAKKYLNYNFGMVERLQKLRDVKGAALLRELAAADADPNFDGCISPNAEDRRLNRPKR